MEKAVLRFGRYAIDRQRRCLIKDGEVVPVGGRAFEVLRVLVEANGALVTKDALIERVWDGRFVSDNALEAQIHGLRRALDADRNLIRTVAGRGYYVVDMEASDAPPQTNLTADISALIARDDLLRDIERALGEHRLVTLLGPGGIGKTRLARAAGRELIDRYPDGVWMIELAPVESDRFVSAAIAETLGLPPGDVRDGRSLAQSLGDRACLLLIDNCEHLVEGVAAIAAELLARCPGVTLLTTTREALRIDGERIIGVPSLPLPCEDDGLEAKLVAPAVQLFVQRLAAANGQLMLAHDMIPMIEICRRLDGIPLAIEMAAASASTLSVAAVLQELDTSMSVLSRPKRIAVPRQQTMEATIAWSYLLLPPDEQAAFRRLSLLSGPFGVEAAMAVADTSRQNALSLLSGLVSKSLLVVTVTERGGAFSLLETMRSYGRARLEEAGELPATASRHAAFILRTFQEATRDLDTLPSRQWVARYKPYLAGLRSAVDWAFSEDGDIGLGAALIIAGEPLWLHLSLVGELLDRIERAIRPEQSNAYTADVSMKLDVAHGCALLYVTGPTTETRATLKRGLAVASRTKAGGSQIRALWALTAASLNSGMNGDAVVYGYQFLEAVQAFGNDADRLIAHRAIGAVHHVIGDQPAARKALETFLNGYVEPAANSPTNRFHFDQQVAGLAFHARVLWLQGEIEPALEAARIALERAVELDHAHSICHALAQASIPLSLDQGHHEAAALYVNELVEISHARKLAVWMVWSRAYGACLDIRTGATRAGLGKLSAALTEPRSAPFSMYHCGLMGELATAQLTTGDSAAALQTVRAAVARASANQELWCLPDLLRLQAVALSRQSPRDGSEIAALLDRAEHLAERQGALLWRDRVRLVRNGER